MKFILFILLITFENSYSQDSTYQVFFDRSIKNPWIYGNINIKGINYRFRLWDGNNNGIYSDIRKDQITCRDSLSSSTTKIKDKIALFLNGQSLLAEFRGNDSILYLKPFEGYVNLENYDIYVSKRLRNIQFQKQFSEDSIHLYEMNDTATSKYILINVWDIGCAPCISAMELYSDLEAYSIFLIHLNGNISTSNERVKELVNKYALKGFKGRIDILARYKIDALSFPYYILCDNNFNVIKRSINITSILNYLYEKK